jgi:DNA ligase-1
MDRLARLAESLACAPADAQRVRRLARHFADTAGPDRGWSLALLMGTVRLRRMPAAGLRGLVAGRVDAALLDWSLAHVGDLAETVALIWPEAAPRSPGPAPGPAEVVTALRAARPGEVAERLTGWLDGLGAPGRTALLKLVSGGLGVRTSPGVVRAALAAWAGRPLATVEAVWHTAQPPYEALFAWLEGTAEPPEGAVFQPLMPVRALAGATLPPAGPADFVAAWTWGGRRVQLVAGGGCCRLFGAGGDDLSADFAGLPPPPDRTGEVVVEGELVLLHDGVAAPLDAPPAKAGRRSAALPWLRLNDLLAEGGTDVRDLGSAGRRQRLEAWWASAAPPRTDLAPLAAVTAWSELASLRCDGSLAGAAGLVLKPRDAPCRSDDPAGSWLLWRRPPLTVDGVLMYARRGASAGGAGLLELTVGAWRDGVLVPVGRVTVDDPGPLRELDTWVRAHTTRRYGPVREVEPALVLTLAFDGVSRSARHASGLVLRGARLVGACPDRTAGTAGLVAALDALATEPPLTPRPLTARARRGEAAGAGGGESRT